MKGLLAVAVAASVVAIGACSLALAEGEFVGGAIEPASDAAAADGAIPPAGGGSDAVADAGGDGDAATVDPVTRGLVIHCRFDEPNGSVVLDSSPNAHHGLFVSGNAGPPTRTSGKVGGALSFAGGSHVEVPRTSSLKVGSAFSVSLWVNAPASNGNQPRLVNLAYDFDVKLNGPNIQLSLGGQHAAADHDLVPNVWTHYAVVFQAGTAKWWVDGTSVANRFGNFDGTLTPEPDTFPLRIGTFEPGASSFTGTLDDVRIYGVALTPEEIRLLAGK